MRKMEASGRIVIPFLRTDFVSTTFNLTLEDGDELVIPRHQETIGILGHIFNPGSFVAEPGLTVESVINRSGGTTEFADDQRVYVIRADGAVENLACAGGSPNLGTILLPGDRVLVPRRPLERTLGAKLADFLHATRQVAEIGMFAQHMATGGQLDVTAVIQSMMRDGLGDYDNDILRPNR